MMKARLIEPVLEQDAYRWLIDLGGRLIGVHAQAGWCVRVDGVVIALEAENDFVPLVPLLEVPEEDFAALLRRIVATASAWSHRMQTFPKETLLKHVFHTSYSGYWPERALSWLAADRALWSQFRDELMAFSTNKSMPQTARQHAQRMLRAITSH
jgi:hypothetical protein